MAVLANVKSAIPVIRRVRSIISISRKFQCTPSPDC
jgi:hypothetical protein